MVDTFFEDATHLTTLIGDEAIGCTSDPSGTPVDRYITPDDLANYVPWIKILETWTYNAANAINVPTDATTRFQKSDKIRFKQGGSYKYFNNIVTAATLLTVTGGTDFTVANAAITDIAISRAEKPFGWPDLFNWNPAPTGYSIAPIGTSYKFRIRGNVVDVFMRENGAGTSDNTTKIYTLPVAAANESRAALPIPVNNGATVAAGSGRFTGSSVEFLLSAGAVWTATGSARIVAFQGSYEY